MILAVLDDLLFSSKIRTTAKELGVGLTFARSPSAALDAMRKDTPSLVIFDLDNPRTDPLAIIAAMKQPGALAAIPTLGFVSHVRADLIQAARAAGIDDVLPRSAFVGQLPDILARGR